MALPREKMLIRLTERREAPQSEQESLSIVQPPVHERILGITIWPTATNPFLAGKLPFTDNPMLTFLGSPEGVGFDSSEMEISTTQSNNAQTQPIPASNSSARFQQAFFSNSEKAQQDYVLIETDNITIESQHSKGTTQRRVI